MANAGADDDRTKGTRSALSLEPCEKTAYDNMRAHTTHHALSQALVRAPNLATRARNLCNNARTRRNYTR